MLWLEIETEIESDGCDSLRCHNRDVLSARQCVTLVVRLELVSERRRRLGELAESLDLAAAGSVLSLNTLYISTWDL